MNGTRTAVNNDGAVERATRIVFRPIANPLPLGFLALGAGTLVVAGLQLDWFAATEGRSVALILLAFVFPLQLLAAIFGFFARDVVAGTGMGVLSATWLAVALVTVDAPPGTTSAALGLLLIFASAALLVPAFVATTGKVLPSLVLVMAGLRFATTGLYELGGEHAWEVTSAIVGLVLCVLAAYAALAMALEDAQRKTVLPVLRRGRGRAAH
jgi:succinate-acetate transporter protein